MLEYHEIQKSLNDTFNRNIFFIIGIPKSGTTWMQHLLNSHPEIQCAGEEDFNRILKSFEAVVNDYNEHMVIVNKKIGTNNHMMFNRKHLEYLVTTALGLLFDNFFENSDIRFIGAKSPVMMTFLGVYAQLLPTAKFLHIIRDGRDVLTSAWIRNLLHSPEETRKRWPAFHDFIRANSATWASDIKNARAFGRSIPDRYFELRYENLHQHPEPVFQKTLTFLGADNSLDRAASCCQAASFENLSKGRKRGQEDPNAFFRKGIIGDWKNHFDQATRDSFMKQAGNLLHELGYE